MTRNEFQQMLEAHGIVFVGDAAWRVAQLVAAAEREKVAAWMIQRSYATGHGDTTEDLLEELEWQVRESERKACIRACEEDAFEDQFDGLGEAVQRIQARGEP